jgi:hypothetical protein
MIAWLLALLASWEIAAADVITRDHGVTRFNGQIVEHHRLQVRSYNPPRYDRQIRVVTHPSLAHLNQTYVALGRGSSGVLAFSDIDGSVCEVHIVDPAVDYQATLIGHEMMHCIYGIWHMP